MTTSNSTTARLWLWPGAARGPEAQDAFRPWLDLYLLDADLPRGAVVVVPGGGYTHRAPHEGEPVARLFNERGYHAFVVQYRVAPNSPMSAFQDTSRSMRLVRSRAGGWGIASGKIAMCGFSAGGHLAGLVGVYGDDGNPPAQDPVEQFSNRPDAMILCYAWLSARVTQPQDIQVPSGDSAEELLRRISVELNVSPKTPPAFLWHTAEDRRVSVVHSLLMVEALRQHDIPLELHIYPHGRHGLGLAQEIPHVASWVNLCCEWLNSMGWHSAGG